MTTKPETERTTPKKPANKATMDQPQEEFIEPESARFENDRDHGHEVAQDLARTEGGKRPARRISQD